MALRSRDVVEVDPRGVGFSDNVKCMSVEDQDDIFTHLDVGVPIGYQHEQRYRQSSKKVARACSENPLDARAGRPPQGAGLR